MELRYRLAVVTGAGGGPGRQIAVALSRRGASVLAVDLDATAAEETATLCREARVSAWSFQADVCDDGDLSLLAGRARDLGGADCLVASGDLSLRARTRLTRLLLDGLAHRRGRTDEPGAVVNVACGTGTGTGTGTGSPQPEARPAAAKAGLVRFTASLAEPDTAARARVTAVIPSGAALDRAPADLCAVVIDLLAHGVAGTVVDLSAGHLPASAGP